MRRRKIKMRATTPAGVPSAPPIRWGYILSNAGLGGFAVVFLVANTASLIRHPRMSVVFLVIFHSTIVILSIVRRDIKTVDRRVVAFAAGWAGTVLPLFLRPTASGADLLAGQVLQIGGLALQLVALVSLGRSFGVVAADRGVQTGGAYRLVRHPIYAAYTIADVGFVMSHPTAANIAAISAAAVTQIIRIWFEERHLSESPEYAEYCRVRRWRLVPGIW